MISGISSAFAGMQRAGAMLERAATKVADPDGDGDQVEGQVEQSIAAATFKASAQLARTADQLIGSMLHVVA